MWKVLGASRAVQGFLPSLPVDLASLVQFQTVLPWSSLLHIALSYSPRCLAQFTAAAAAAAAAGGCGGRLGTRSVTLCATLTHLPSLAIGNIVCSPGRFCLCSGCWLVLSYMRIFHSKLGPIFGKTVFRFRSLRIFPQHTPRAF